MGGEDQGCLRESIRSDPRRAGSSAVVIRRYSFAAEDNVRPWFTPHRQRWFENTGMTLKSTGITDPKIEYHTV